MSSTSYNSTLASARRFLIYLAPLALHRLDEKGRRAERQAANRYQQADDDYRQIKNFAMTKLKRLDILFLLTGGILLTLCLPFRDTTLDINVHDTYFVIAYVHIGIFCFLICGLFSFVYFLIRRHRNYIAGLVHLILTIPLLVQIIFSNYFFMSVAPRRYFANSDIDDLFEAMFPKSFYVVCILFGLGQTLFLINLLISIIKTINLRTRN